jgi:hypothetical protein
VQADRRTLEYNSVVTRRNSPDTLKALVDSLRSDPFYIAISQDFGEDEVRRRKALACYFDYFMSDGDRRGRLVVWPTIHRSRCLVATCSVFGVRRRVSR